MPVERPVPLSATRWTLLGGLALVLALVAFGTAWRAAARPDEKPAKPKVEAPELDGGVSWLNTDKPIKMKDLKGKVVVLDFWTFCCINCIHTLPDLAKLEKKYEKELVVIGVHSAKFENEKDTEKIKKAILRYEIKHPVVNDAEFKIWAAYRASAWPTLILIDPDGNLVAKGSGEGLYEALDEEIGKLVKEHKDKGTLNVKPLKFELSREAGDSPLSFPGKVLADDASSRLFIADSTNHRVVVTDLNGTQIAVAGSGAEGNKDGTFAEARFSDPQGMALRGDTLYVADRKNHVIRALDLKSRKVTTVAGTGTQGRDRAIGEAPALKVGLNSPWDLLLRGDKLYIAMAGSHQIWRMDLTKNTIAPFAGNGRENIVDGRPEDAEFAQPSGLATDGKSIFVADSEVSAIRAVPFNTRADVTTLIGEGLFKFGDVDSVVRPERLRMGAGPALAAFEPATPRLQHALGVAFIDGKLYVADTYNSKIKVMDPEKKTIQTFVASEGGKPAFNEPSGLSFAGGKLYVADTNAHRIRVIDLKTKEVKTLKLQGVERPKAS